MAKATLTTTKRRHTTQRRRVGPWVKVFLDELRRNPNVTAASQKAGISRFFAYKRREQSPTFATAWEECYKEGIECWAAECARRGLEGYEEPVVYQGKIAMQDGKPVTVRKFSDNLAMFMLKQRDPSYREHFTVSGDPDNPLHTVVLVGTERNLKAQLVEGESKRLPSGTDDN